MLVGVMGLSDLEIPSSVLLAAGKAPGKGDDQELVQVPACLRSPPRPLSADSLGSLS